MSGEAVAAHEVAMRPSVLAFALVAALLMPADAAVADPPWGRGHDYQAHGGAHYAGGPPPWAPAHGWRRKHAHYYEHAPVYVVPDLGIELGRCNRDVIGAVIGGVAGGVIGSHVGKGSDRTVATIGGAIAGVLIGGAIGRSMDKADHACVAQTLEQARARQPVAWSNPAGGHYRVVPLEGYEDHQGRICRDYRTTATIEGRQQGIYGTACRQPDGSWQRVS
jgi:surface antigen